MPDLTKKKCVPCEGGIDPLPREKVEGNLKAVPGWILQQTQDAKGVHDQIVREFKFKDFKSALGFVNKVGELAEAEGHHPNIYLYGWNKVRLELSTHTIGGLSENDFIIAAKVNALEPSNI